MKSVIVFLKNVWNAQRNAEANSRWERNAEVSFLINEDLADKNIALRAENAALRSQISQRDASGKFTKKNAS